MTNKVLQDKLAFWHGLAIGDRVQCVYAKQKSGTTASVVACEVGRNKFGMCGINWEDGTSTLEHPEHLHKLRRMQPLELEVA